MTISVLKPGLQTTIQAAPRIGMRHLGVPRSGAADCLSHALANRLLGNDLFAPVLEAALVGPSLRINLNTSFALTGAHANATLNGESVDFHRALHARAGDELNIGPVGIGSRVYIAFAGSLFGDDILGSMSTYLPAGFGGYRGRPLAEGDVLQIAGRYSACD
ncbi:MAG: biotin-dependent carboxyltransferase family protein, partial [Gammaproteobacteria bacterium]|nr:biotin-dependent carboxyltransferase family protein [Gammaproteobacteria bacterium]